MSNPFERMPGKKQEWRKCPTCSGTGKSADQKGKCTKCNGDGKVADR